MMSLPTEDRTQLFKDTAIQFWKHITPIVYVALGIHCVLLTVFLGLGMKIMWMANIVSTLIYVNCIYLIRRGRHRQAGQLMCLEIIGHAVLATWQLGWESNFSFYIFCVIPVIAFTFQLNVIRRIAYSVAILLSLVGCFVFRRYTGQGTGLSQNVLDAFGIVNVLSATTLSIYATALSVRFTSSMQLSLFHIANRDSLTNLYTRRRVLHRIRDWKPGGRGCRLR